MPTGHDAEVAREARLREFVGGITSSESPESCWQALSHYLHLDDDEPYWSVWYSERGRSAAASELLLVHESGSRHGGSVRSEHSRIDFGTGIVGTSMLEGSPLSWPGANVLPASPRLVATEELVDIRAYPWSSEPAGVLLVGYRTHDGARLDAETVSFAGAQTLAAVTRQHKRAADDVLKELVTERSARPSLQQLLTETTRLLGRRMRLKAIAALVEADTDMANAVFISWPSPSPTEQGAAAVDADWRLLAGSSSIRLFGGTDLNARTLQNTMSPDTRAAIADHFESRKDDHVMLVPFKLTAMTGARRGALLLTRGRTDVGFLPEEQAAVEATAALIGRLIVLLSQDEAKAKIISWILQLMGNEETPLDESLSSLLITLSECVPLLAGVGLIYREDAWQEIGGTSWLSARESTLDTSSDLLKELQAGRLTGGSDLLWRAAPARPTLLGASLKDQQSSIVEVAVPVAPFSLLSGALVLQVRTSSGLMDEASDTRMLLQLLGRFLTISEETKRVTSLRTLIDAQDRYRTASAVSVAFAHELNHVFARYRLRLQNATKDVKKLSGLASQAGDTEIRRLSHQMDKHFQTMLRWATDAERMSHVLSRSNLGLSSIGQSSSEPIYLNDVITDYGPALGEIVKASQDSDDRRLKLEFDLDPELSRPPQGVGHPVAWGFGDDVRLGQILVNLVSNARRASPNGGKIQVGTSRQSGQPRLEVRDFGHGIPAELKSQIFDPFFTTSQADGGTGMGLFVVQNLCRELNAQLELTSEENRGATFTVLLPSNPPVENR